MGMIRCDAPALWLFGPFPALPLAEAHAGAAAVLVDEFEARFFKRSSDFVGGRLPAAKASLLLRFLSGRSDCGTNACCSFSRSNIWVRLAKMMSKRIMFL
jgi:hypothetical protein